MEGQPNDVLSCYVRSCISLVYMIVCDCSLLISLCTIMSHLTFSCISLCHTFSYTQNGGTPLYVACQNGHKQTVDVLLKNGANVNLTCTVSLINPLCTWTERVIVLYVWSVCMYLLLSLTPQCATRGPRVTHAYTALLCCHLYSLTLVNGVKCEDNGEGIL